MIRGFLAMSFLLLAGCSAAGLGVDAQRRALSLVDAGVVLLREGRLDEARASFQVARDLYPLAAAVDGLGCVAFYEDRLDDAEYLFQEAYEMDDTYDRPLANLALVHEARGDREKAAQFFLKSIAAEPDNGAARNNRAALLRAAGRRSEAVIGELLRAEALEKHPIIEENLKRME